MDAGRWERVNQIVNACLEMGRAQRETHLAAACAADADLRAEVESLLAAHDEADDFLQVPALEHRRIGNYELRELIGEGGMGAVYRAVRTSDFEKQVALKLVKRGMDTDYILRRFRHERQILAGLDHPNIARLLDGGATAEGLPYLVMDYIEGTPVTDYCEEHALPVPERLRLFRTVCAAVQYAHQNLVVHRDLKPGNILITAEGAPKLLDFGIAKLLEPEPEQTATLVRMMTPECASPEQVRGEPVTTATDIYALGVLLYQLLAGERPYHIATSTQQEMARVICETDPAPPSARRPGLAADLDNIVMKAMHKDPQRRYASVEQFSEDLRRYLAGLPVLARKDTFAYRASKFVRRHKAATLAAGLLLLSLAGGMAATLWEAHIARVERARAQARFDDVRKLANSLLFELHDALEPLAGATAVRELLVKRAAEFLDRLANNAGSDDSLRRELATAYGRLGQVQGSPGVSNLGDTAGAIASYTKAAKLLEQVIAGKTGTNRDRRWLAASYDQLGQLDGKRADEYVARAVQVRRALAERLPPADAAAELAMSDYYIATRRIMQGDPAAGLESYRKALAGWEKAAAAYPDNLDRRQPVAIAHKHVGGVLAELRKLDESLEHYQAAQRIEESLLQAHPGNARQRLDITYTYSDIGYIYWERGDRASALANYRKAQAVREELAAADPKEMRVHWALASSSTNLGALLAEMGDWKGAIASHRKALEVREAMDAVVPRTDTELGVMYSCYELGRAYRHLAEHARAGGQAESWRTAQSYFQRAGRIAEGLKSKVVLGDQRSWLTAGIHNRELGAGIVKDLPRQMAACERGMAQ